MNDYRYVWRFISVVALVTVAFGGLTSRLVFLHLQPHETVDETISRMHRVEKPISMGRGKILDRKGHVLAIDLPARDIWIDPQKIKDENAVRKVVSELGRLLDIEVDELYIKIKKSSRRGLRIARFVENDKGEKVEELDLPGVWTKLVNIRNYPQSELLCHVLGFMNWSGQPAGGVEQHFNSNLQGRDGLLISEKDGRRRELYNRRSLKVKPEQGADITLTIDLNLQEMLEKSLEKVVAEHNPEGAWAIMQRVRTGEILAMASRPEYNPNSFRFSSKEARRNRAISYVYEPGSTFKPLVIAAALNEGIVKPSDSVFCEDGCWSYKGRLLHDTHEYGKLTVSDVVKKSSNIGTAKIALKLGNDKLEDYLRDYGLGCQTQVELPGEEQGILHDNSSWSAISATRIAMGHEIAVTALQMLNATCAVVNGGYLMRPTVIKRIADAEGKTVYESRPEVLGRVIDARTSGIMRRMLATVTEDDGTGWRARVPGYVVGGKTGTAQKAIPGGYSHSEHMSSFVGFLPAEDPEIAMIVVVDNPQPIHYGGVVAAPVFSEVAGKAVRYLRILPASRGSYARRREEYPATEGSKEL